MTPGELLLAALALALVLALVVVSEMVDRNRRLRRRIHTLHTENMRLRDRLVTQRRRKDQ